MSRGLDLILSIFGLLLLAPVFVIIVLLIAWRDGMPVFFSQVRVGKNGKHFKIWKFRTMQKPSASEGLLLTLANDTRITGIGMVLRRTKLDELPQLINVAIGDMALVGPRPEVPYFVDMWAPDDRAVILSVRPGLTDPVTLAAIDEEDRLARDSISEQAYIKTVLPQKVRGYLAYVEKKSIAGDIIIILQTGLMVARRLIGLGPG